MTLASVPAGKSEAWALASAWNGRLAGLDAARALALVGMFAAHVGDAGTRGQDTDGWRWLWVADGRSSALFAVLAGVTISLMGAKAGTHHLRHTAARIAVRGGVLIVAGYVLDALDTPVDAILTNLGLMFLLVIPAMRWRAGAQAAAGALILIGGGAGFMAVEGFARGIPIVEKFASQHYPALAWTGYLLVGMAVGRLPLRTSRAAGQLITAGAGVAVAAYGIGAVLGGALPWADARVAHFSEPAWASVAPHANTPFELVGNTGVALLLIGVCLLISRPSAFTFPVLAFGSMSLTMYTAHLVVIAVVGDEMVWQPSNVALVVMTLALLVAATVWRVAAGAGPLERLLTSASSRTADAAVGAGRGAGAETSDVETRP